MPSSLKEHKNRVFSNKIAEVLEVDEQFDFAALSKTEEWINRAKHKKSQFHSITAEMVKDWTAEAAEEFEELEAKHEEWLLRKQAGAGAAAAPTKPAFPPRSLSSMLRIGQLQLAKSAKKECTAEEKKWSVEHATRAQG